MTHPHDVPAPSPTVLEAMRESVDAHLKAQCERWGIRLGSGSRTQLAIDLCTGPIASALAALERDNATLRAERDEADAKAKLRALALFVMEEKFEQAASDATGWHSEYKNERREKNSACSELASLRASAERMETAHAEEVARLTAQREALRSALVEAGRRLADIAGGRAFQPRLHAATGHAQVSLALTPKETPDA